MAFNRSTSTTVTEIAAASVIVELPAHTAGDLLLVFATNDVGTSAITATAGWTLVQGAAASDTIRGVVAYRLATLSNHTLTLTGTLGQWVVSAQAWGDADSTQPIDAILLATSAVGATHTTPVLTTTTANCAIVHAYMLDSSITARPRVSEANAFPLSFAVNDGTESISLLSAYNNQSVAGASTGLQATMGATNGGHVAAVAIRNSVGGSMGQNPTSGIASMYRTFTTGNQGTASLLSTIFGAATVDGLGFSTTLPTWTTATVLSDAPQEATGYFPLTQNTAGTWCGAVTTLAATTNVAGLALSVMFGISSTSRFGSGGFLFALIDTANNYRVYRMQYKSSTSASRLYSFDFLPDTHPTVLASGGAISLTSINRIAIACHRNGASATANNLFIRNFCSLGTVSVTGGGTNSPIDLHNTPYGIQALRTAYRGSTQGISQVQLKQPVQIGNGGTNLTNFKASATSYELPLPYSAADRRLSWNLPARAGLTINAGSSDVIDCSAAIFRANDAQAFTIDALSSTAAIYSFEGAAIFGWNVTWKTGVACNLATFQDCGVIDIKAASFSNCLISDSRSTTHAMLMESGAIATLCTFTKGAETYAIAMTAGTLDITDTTFVNYTTQLNILSTSGTATIKLSSTQTTPTYVTAGATVVFERPVVNATATVAGFTANSRIVVYNVTTGIEVYNAKAPGTTWTLNYVNGAEFTFGDVVDIYHTYFNTTTNTSTLRQKVSTQATTTGWSVYLTEETDAVYTAYSTTYLIDGSTVTEFAQDPVNLQIDITDLDNVWYAHRLYAWNAYKIWNEGARRFFTEITATDAGNISIGAVLLDNTRNVTAYQSDVINIFNDNNSLPVVNPTSGGGGISMYSGGKVLVASSAGIAPSESQIRTWVRTELAAEMARIDVATSTRLAATDYLAPTLAQIEASTVLAKEATVSTRATQTSVTAIPTNPLLTTDVRLDNLDAAITTRLATVGYTAPANADIAAIKAKTDTLVNTDISTLATAASVTALGSPMQASSYVVPPTAAAIATAVEIAILTEGDGQAVLQAIATQIGNENVSATTIAAAVRTNLATELARIDVATSTRLATADYSAGGTDTAAIVAALKPSLTVINEGVQNASLLVPHSTDLP